MRFFFLLILFCSSILSAQDINNKIADANKAIAYGNYAKAIKIYKKLIRQNKTNSDLRIDLANVYIIANEVDNACECLYEAAILSNAKAVNLINEKCKNYNNGKTKLLADVDKPPMFLYKGTYYNLIESNAINPLYRKAVYDAMFGKEYLTAYKFLNVSIDVKIDSEGKFVGDVNGLRESHTELKMIKDGLEDILKHRIIYKPAIYNNTAVEVFQKFRIPMN